MIVPGILLTRSTRRQSWFGECHDTGNTAIEKEEFEPLEEFDRCDEEDEIDRQAQPKETNVVGTTTELVALGRETPPRSVHSITSHGTAGNRPIGFEIAEPLEKENTQNNYFTTLVRLLIVKYIL